MGSLLTSLLLGQQSVLKYSDDQPRDNNGRFASGGKTINDKSARTAFHEMQTRQISGKQLATLVEEQWHQHANVPEGSRAWNARDILGQMRAIDHQDTNDGLLPVHNIIAETHDGKFLGAVQGISHGEGGMYSIDYLAVNPGVFTGQIEAKGVGIRLMVEAAQRAAEHDQSMRLISWDDNSDKFYRKIGMTEKDGAFSWTREQVKVVANSGVRKDDSEFNFDLDEALAAEEEFGPPLAAPKEDEEVNKAESDEHWITVNGQHIMIGAHGEVKGGNPKVFSGKDIEAKFKPSEKMLRAMQAYKPCEADKQRLADEQEAKVSRALGIPRTKNNAAFDLNDGKVGVELKTMVDSKNGKITMSKDALARKLNEAKTTKVKMYTVVADRRAGQTQYYYRSGVGSFRVNSMTPVTLTELKSIVRGK